MEAKHTPGEWHVHLVDEASVVIPRRPFRQVISVLGGSEVSDEMDYANARLIAAAPDLLEALIAMDEAMRNAGNPHMSKETRAQGRQAIISARAAIAKATS